MTPRRWLYVLGGLVGVLAIVVVIVLVTRDDDSDSASSTTTTSSSTSTTVGPTTTTAAPTTTVAPTTTMPTTPTTTLPLPPVTDDPQSYAEYLFVAWQNANRTAAGEVADAEAVNQLFAQAYSPQSQWVFDMCDPAAGSLYCTWNAANGQKLVMTVRTLTGGLPIRVLGVQFQTP